MDLCPLSSASDKPTPAPIGLNNTTGALCWFNSLLQALLSLPALQQACARELESRAMPPRVGLLRELALMFESPSPTQHNACVRALVAAAQTKLDFSSQEGAANGLVAFLEALQSTTVDLEFMTRYRMTILCSGCGQTTSSQLDESTIIDWYGEAAPEGAARTVEAFSNKVWRRVTAVDFDCELCGHKNCAAPRTETLRRLGSVVVLAFRTQQPDRWYPPRLEFSGVDLATRLRFELVATVLHHGSVSFPTTASSGHYTACVRRGSTWYATNDSFVQPLPIGPPAPSAATHLAFYHFAGFDRAAERE